jgi:Lon protease-like protein
MFPLGTVLFPHAQLPLHIFEPRYRALARDCLATDATFGIVLIERGSEVGGGDQRAPVGTLAIMSQATELDDGRWLLVATGVERIRIIEWLPDAPYPLAVVEEWPEEGEPVATPVLREVEQCVRRTRGLLAESGASAAMSPDAVLHEDTPVASWQLCAEAPASAFDAQRLLSSRGSSVRMELLSELAESVEDDLRRMLAGECEPPLSEY